MVNRKLNQHTENNISRRKFLNISGIVLASSTAPMVSEIKQKVDQKIQYDNPIIKEYRTLGRTGFKVSDISMGGTRVKETNVWRYAYDHGINYFDTAEGYINGESERRLGNALKYMDRKKVFITTKLGMDKNDKEENILNRFRKCQERLQTEYIDCLYIHGVERVDMLNHTAFHSVVKKLKSENSLRFSGLSCHGPEDAEADSIEKVVCAAAEDGRFDVMLFVYNFMNKKVGEKMIKACKENNVGTTVMKTTPGSLNMNKSDSDNLTEEQLEDLEFFQNEEGMSKDEALEELRAIAEEDAESFEKTKPFLKKYHIKTEDQLYQASLRWILESPDIHTICMSFDSFDLIDKVVPLSGTKLSRSDRNFINEYRIVYNNLYCRHGCNACSVHCPYGLPVGSIMRYVYYYNWHGLEKEAMRNYAKLRETYDLRCIGCAAPCANICPYSINIKTSMIKAHSTLTLA